MQLDRLREFVAASRTAQGLPPAVEDVATIEQVAAIMRLAEDVREAA